MDLCCFLLLSAILTIISTAETSQQTFVVIPPMAQDNVEPVAINEHNIQFYAQAMNSWTDPLLQFSANAWDYPASPGCYSDLGPEMHMEWAQSTTDADIKPFGGIARASTLPHMGMMSDVVETSSPLPSIQITSHHVSPVASPQAILGTPMQDPVDDISVSQSFSKKSVEGFNAFLAPGNHPPIKTQYLGVGSDTEQSAAWPSATESSRRRSTICLSSAPRITANRELSWMLDSPRTTGYLKKYKEVVQGRYPFLDSNNPPGTDETPYPALNLQHGFVIYQRLLQAAIGAMLTHKARDIAARYLRHAMSMQDTEGMDFFHSIDGIHCALLLVVYLYLESQIVFEDESLDDDVGHPHVNVWQWSCRIAAACIDLGLHSWVDGNDAVERVDHGEGKMRQRLCRNTFRSVWKLDGEISNATGRPRALHAESIDPVMMAWILRQEGMATKL
jgi:hypothetical protein